MRRIIPARAGFTVLRLGYRDGVRDHPRSRGVYCARSRARMSAGGSSPLARGLLTDLLDPEQQYSGSSPLARGLQQQPRSQHITRRIIPARAGFTDGR